MGKRDKEEVKVKKVRKYPLWVNKEEREIRQRKFQELKEEISLKDNMECIRVHPLTK